MRSTEDSTQCLVKLMMQGDQTAFRDVFEQYRGRLLRAIKFRMDPRLAKRLEAEDIVQEALAEASRRLPEFLNKDGYSFYAWIRTIAMSRLQDAHRRHVVAVKRSLSLEDNGPFGLPDESVFELAHRIVGSGITPSAEVRKRESVEYLQVALARLDDDEREVLILKYIEDLDASVIAAIQDVSERHVRRKHRQAIEKLGRELRRAGLDSST
jgi:RNA polymerase sigma-70 factor (ECF subfamily)